MRKLIKYSENKEVAYYDDGSIAHRHILNKNDITRKQLGCRQGYFLVVSGKCSHCGKNIK